MHRVRRSPCHLLALSVLLLAGCPSPGGTTTPDLQASCADDSQCAAPTPHCNASTKLCVACTMDPQCPDGQLCVMNRCVPGCSQTKGCGDAGMCDTVSGKCSTCAADGDCKDAANPRCDTKTGRCVPCLTGDTDNCGAGKYCVEMNGGYTCASGCAKDLDCKANVDGGGGGGGAASCCNHVCIDTTVDNKNCGACGKSCTNGTVCCNGACVNTANDVANCGACGRACAGPNATLACEQSKCVIQSCNAGFADCDKNPDDGCEVNTDTDPMNCLGCGSVCSVAHGAAGCNKGCTVGKCDPGFADCDKQFANGCEIASDIDVANCGACGNVCKAVANGTPGCAAGTCAVIACAGTFLDCDKTFANGCEIDASRDPKNCGKCGTACPAVANGTPGCASGMCGVGACNAPFRDCNGALNDGCEVNLNTDVKNCGACGKACPAVANGTAGCAAGVCGIAACATGYADCNGNPNDGCEINTTNDLKNCGKCANACPGGANSSPTCANSICGLIPCNAPFQDCDGNGANGCETNTSNDIRNCGACGKACAAVANGTAGCAVGNCGIAVCTQPFKDCDGVVGNGCEVNVNTDVANCGACGTRCAVANGVAACNTGACAIGSCNAGFKDCNVRYADGCEINTNTDIANCGACGTVCAVANGTPGCTNGACGIAACSAGFANCDANVANGCEINTTNNVNNCGACGKVCGAVANGTPGCAAGVCGVGSCNAPFANCDGNAANGCETNTTTDPNNCGACGNACPLGVCTNGQCKEKVLIVGAPSTPAWNTDVQTKLQATGAFSQVDVVQANTTTPALATLQQYQAVLVYSDAGFLDSVALGNNLADYFDGGGRVVVAVFANTQIKLAGRWDTGGYHLLATNNQGGANQAAALKIVDATSPLVAGVATLTSTSGFCSTGGPINGGVVVAYWGDGTTPLIVRGAKNGRAIAELNFYPPSTAVRADFWAGDGATIMKNALMYKGWCHSIVGKNGGVCVSGKREFCDPSAQIVGTNAAQAQAACQACYGATCYLETADCAGNGYGPKPAGQYVGGDAYFGYVAGCSGAAGRIWAMSSSYTTYGRWAP